MSTTYSVTLGKIVSGIFLTLGLTYASGFPLTALAAADIVAINSGGTAVSNSGGGDTSFAADEFVSGGGTAATGNIIATAGVANAAPAAVYQTERAGTFTYTIPGLTAGAQYTVLLHFAEFYWTAPGQRVFNVAINGNSVLSNFDIVATAGANQALVEQFTAAANSSGQLVISYTNGSADQPKSSGIEIRGPSCTSVPAAPSGVAATASSSSAITLTWNIATPPANCVIASYSVYGSATSGFSPSSATLLSNSVTGTSYSNTGLAASTPYYYVVEAVDAAGASGPSTQATATTLGGGNLTDLVAIAAGGAAVSNAGGGDASFVADEYFSGGGTATTTNAIATLGIANAAPQAVYQSERSGTFTYTIPGLTPGLSYPVLLQFAEFYWTAPGQRVFNVAINGTAVLTNFDIVAAAGPNTALVEGFNATANGSGQIVISFTVGTADQPKVSGIEILPAGSVIPGPPAPPTALTAATASISQINLGWNASPTSGAQYLVFRSVTSPFTPGSANLVGTASSPAFTDTGLAAFTTYYYQVEATDRGGTSAAIGPASATTSGTGASTPPTNLTAVASSSTQTYLNWAPSATAGVQYLVFRSTTSPFTPGSGNQVGSTIGITNFADSGLSASTSYYYMVEASDSSGTSAAAGPASVTTLGGASSGVPGAPTGLTATAASANEIDLTWNASTVAGVQYFIFRSTTPTFTPASTNQVGATKSNNYQDVVLSASTTYYYMVEANNTSGSSAPAGTPNATTAALGTNAPFWDASGLPVTHNVMMFKFLNRTNGQYSDDQIFWSMTLNGVTTTNSIAAQPYFDMPANASGRMYFYLGNVGQNANDYYDFIEYTIGTTFFNGDTTRVDAFGIKLAMQLTCGDGTNIAVGENAQTFAESRATTFQRYINAVPTEFQPLATLQAPYRIVSPAAGGFDTGGQYANYYSAYISQIWSSNGLTIPLAGPNGDGLGAYPDLSAAIYRHTAAPGTFNPNGTLNLQTMWGNPAAFYQTAPASYYAQFLHANAINGQQYAFPYDDAGGYSADVSCSSPQTLLVAVGW